MSTGYVAINDETHQILRGLTSNIAIRTKSSDEGRVHQASYDLTDIGKKMPDLYFFTAYEGIHEMLLDLSEDQKVRFAKKRRFFDATLVDRRCMGTKRLLLVKEGTSLLSAELLCFGAGALRQLWDNPIDPSHGYFRRRLGRINSVDMVVHERIPSTFQSIMLNRRLPECWESTNIIYGDAYGELEQIWKRRKEPRFLTGIAMALNKVTKRPRTENVYAYYDAPVPVVRMHLDTQLIWTTPIISSPELLRRVRFILENTSLDSNPLTILETGVASPRKTLGGDGGSGTGSNWRNPLLD